MKKKNSGSVLRKKLLDSILLDSVKRVKDNTQPLFFTMLVDFLFFLSIILLNFITLKVIPSPADLHLGVPLKMFFVVIILGAYFCTIVLIYSFLKLVVLEKMLTYFGLGRKRIFSCFIKFFYANLRLVGIFVLLALLFSGVFTMPVRVTFIFVLRNLLLFLTGFLFYLSVNTMHSIYALHIKMPEKIVRKTFAMILNNPGRYIGISIFSLFAVFTIILVYYVFDYLLLMLLGGSVSAPGVFFAYGTVSVLVSAVLVLGLLAFNRVYFYNLTQNEN